MTCMIFYILFTLFACKFTREKVLLEDNMKTREELVRKREETVKRKEMEYEQKLHDETTR